MNEKIEWKKMAIRALIAFILISLSVGGCTWVNSQIGKNDDWFGEEILEDVIEGRTGIKIDLSQGSPEK